MRKFFFAFALVIWLCTALAAQANPTRIALTPNSTVPSADIVRNLGSDCPDVSLTTDATKADFTLEAMQELNANGHPIRFKFTLFNKDGDAIYSTATHRVANAVKDVCRAIQGQKK